MALKLMCRWWAGISIPYLRYRAGSSASFYHGVTWPGLERWKEWRGIYLIVLHYHALICKEILS
uniref:Uncharacterized protein n=1 Tax=Aegilops tauschii subsp. strangulata TaxID=200361 RepID=A0A453N5J8_AEGTS